MTIIKMTDLDLFGKRILIRADLNVPIKKGEIISDVRIRASLPTIEYALNHGARVMISSHLGNPTEGEYDNNFSLAPIMEYLKRNISNTVRLEKDYLLGVGAFNISPEELVVLENVRFNKGEMTDDDVLAKKYASLCDIFVMDAFGASHRAQASTHGVCKYAPISCAGPLLLKELTALDQALDNPARPMVAIVGGSKISTKLTVIESLSKIADQLIVGGGIANTFLAAYGFNIGRSLCETDLIPEAKRIIKTCDIPIPIDVRTATEFSKTAVAIVKYTKDIKDNDQILDLGDESIANLATILKRAKTILWNGPVGVFEFKNFRKGTEALALHIAESKAFSIAGGGDTITAIDLFGIAEKISYISTGGGAFLKYVEGKKLPVIEMLEKHAL